MIDAPPIPDLELALRLVESVQDHPKATRDEAASLVAREGLDQETLAVSWWALGLAARQLNDLDEADSALRTALRIANEAGLTRRVGQIRSSHALVLLYTGATQSALEETELAMAELSGRDLARNEMQLGLILQRLGRLDEALVRYRSALVGLRRSGDRLAEARLLSNRGVLHG